jgi:hypothetical protein
MSTDTDNSVFGIQMMPKERSTFSATLRRNAERPEQKTNPRAGLSTDATLQ